MPLRNNFFVLTGASGSGKSSLIAELRARGQVCVEEIGRQVVREELRIGGDGTPWDNHGRFMDLLLAKSVEAFHAVHERIRPVFFDRGIPECMGHAYRLDTDRRAPFLTAIGELRYNSTVFVTPPWEEIYMTDAERRHSFAEGVRSHREELTGYIAAGYALLEVPRMPIGDRVGFILTRTGR